MNPIDCQQFFFLNPDCFLVKGARRGALYNLASGDVYSIDPVAVDLLERCEARASLSRVVEEVNGPTPEQILAYLGRVRDEGMGRFDAQGRLPAKIDLRAPCRKLDFLWLELREDCNLKCRHCYCMSAPRMGARSRLTLDEWRRVLEEGAELGCKAIQFIGGEPFLFGIHMFDLAAHASDLGYDSIGVFSNLTFLKDEWIDRLVQFHMSVSFSLYSRRPEIHDRVTGKPGSFERTMANVHRLRERGIQPRPCVTVMKQNQDYIEETMEFLRELGEEKPGFDLVRPSGRGNDDEIVPDKLSRRKAYGSRAEFMKTDRDTFVRRYNGNSCWQGKLAIGSSGDVHPCIMQRDGDSGNVREQSLREIIEGGIRKYWDLSLDKIETCQDCEYRYACHDCRPITAGPRGGLTAKSAHCSYDPYRGEFVDCIPERDAPPAEAEARGRPVESSSATGRIPEERG